ncbi:Non-specific lipid-transfer protein 1 [Forsythia ovata]|uniref:Non-specific lipid-transfer protein n=1 Tax=Forsythia ovata TaxID=205694 RepID=A0ABD1SI30_9LAMI
MFAKVVCLVLLCMVVVAFPPHAEAITCSQISASLAPCLGFLQGGALVPRCCYGVKSVVAAARTTTDRQSACRCLQAAAKSFRGINLGNAAALPGRCGANIPYKISPTTDCSKYI